MSVNHANYGRLGERVMIHTIISQAFLIPASSEIIRAVTISSALNGQRTNIVMAEITTSKLPMLGMKA